ncbi:MAG: sulfatase [Polyangiaceae bacterium]
MGERVAEASRGTPPAMEEAALGLLAGGVIHASADVVAILVALPFTGARGAHLGFAALEGVGVAAAMALVVAGLSVLGRARGWAPWIAYTALTGLGLGTVLLGALRRQASLFLGGAVAPVLLPTYLVLVAIAVPAAHVLGALFGRLGRVRWLGVLAGLAGLVVGHTMWRDDHPDVHLAIFWVAAVLAGQSLVSGPGAARRFRRLRGPSLVVALAAITIAPPNPIRLELFAEPGSVAAFALAQLTWSPPEVTATTPAPQVVRARDQDRAVVRRGLPDDPVVVLLTVDALRADVVLSGEHDGRWPNLVALRDGGASFLAATAPGSQTSVTLTSLFSGRYFSQLRWDYHGEGASRFQYAAADPTPRFVARLSEAGVDTQSFLGLIFLSEGYGVTRGFATERVLVEGRHHAHVSSLLPPLIQAVATAEGPSFFFAHLMEPHAPYDRGTLRRGSDFERYLSEIDVVDRWLGRVVASLRRHHPRRGYLLVSADHGEAFGEHGTHHHTKTLYEELIHVPLILWGPGIPPIRIPERVSLIDVGPTLLHLFGLPPDEGAMGVSLLSRARGLLGRGGRRPVAAEGRLRRVLYGGSLKVIEDLRRRTVEVYDLSRDPGELHNLFAGTPTPEVARLVAEARAFFRSIELSEGGYSPPYKP